MTPSSAYVSRDGKAVFVGIPDMKPVMQMRLAWTLKTQSGSAFSQNAYFTPYELTSFNPATEGFDPIDVDLRPRAARAPTTTPVTIEEGQRIATLMGCAGCHSTDGTTNGKIGPSWKGLFGSARQFVDGTRTVADAAYLRQSIRTPTARIVKGFDKPDTGMPPYAGVLTDAQIEAVIAYIKSLK